MANQSSLFGDNEQPRAKKDITPSGRKNVSIEQKISHEEPLAARMRPRTIDEVIGQEQLVAPGRLLRRSIEADRITSMIFWGPPGSGKTTLAEVIAHSTHA